MKKLLSILITAFLLTVPALEAKIQLPHVIASNMVLQQQSTVKLWGTARSNAKVSVTTSWNNKAYACTSNKDGHWIVSVTTPKAGGPFTVTISDGEKLVLNNIMSGEVWFCSGQSNMEMPVKGYSTMPSTDCNNVIAKAKPSVPIRMFMAKRISSKTPKDDIEGTWMVNSTKGVAECSATAYFFARYIQDVLEVPVGIVVSCWGGSSIETWMSPEAVKSAAPELPLDHLTPEGKVKVPNHDASLLYYGMLNPFFNLKFRGMLWYQGETNAALPEQYGRLMKGFVSELRKEFPNGDFPFYYVQISPYEYNGADKIYSALLRETQMKVMNEIPNVGMACTLDIGEKYNIHPKAKDIVGERLAYWALAKTYGMTDFSYCGPIYKSMNVKDGKAIISFTYDDNGLIPFMKELEGFETAGADRVFHPAKALFHAHATTVEVTSDEVKEPVAVRYCFKNWCVGSFFNSYGLPASSFRTDDWPIDK